MKKGLLCPLVILLFLNVSAINNFPPCEIGTPTATILPCNEEGNFYIKLNFEYGGIGEEGFSVQGNGNNYGSFEYGNLPVQIGPLEGDGTTIYEFVVIDNQYEDCTNWTAIDPVDCGGSGDCEIWDVWADDHPCNDNGYFYVLLGFDYVNVGEEGFRVKGNGTNYGNFEYGDLPVEIGPLLGDGVTVYEFIVKDLQYNDCSDWTELGPIDCSVGSDCDIYDMEIVVWPCNDDGFFWVDIDFEYENIGGEGFDAYVNDDYIGHFWYEQLPIEYGPLEGDGETIYNFFIVDTEFESCHDWEAIDPVDCEGGGGDCEIGELEIEILPCNEEGNFFVVVDFDYANVSDEGFKLFVNWDLYESYDYNDLPIEVGPLVGDGETPYHFLVRDIVYEDCASDGSIEAVDCEGSGNTCEIGELDIEILPCNEGDNFFVEIDFEYANVGTGFLLYVNEDLWDDYTYNALPIEVGPLAGDGTTSYGFLVKDAQHEDCNSFADIEPVNCDQGDGVVESDNIIYPNPNHRGDVFNINKELSIPRNIFIYDIEGDMILKEENSESDQFKINRRMEAGMYFFVIETVGKTYRGKLIIE